MIPYIGCISRQDARLLQNLAWRSQRILEFGSGASTQIFAAYSSGSILSVETHPDWIVKTKLNLDMLGIKKPVAFVDHFVFEPSGTYDLVFVDGIDEFRLPFALMAWPYLTVGGMMAFHDTRRTKPHGPSKTSDVQNVCALIQRFSTEVDRVVLNQDESNTTLVTKRSPLLYEDWQKIEGRTDAQMGLA